jgi:hypothetical protein
VMIPIGIKYPAEVSKEIQTPVHSAPESGII